MTAFRDAYFSALKLAGNDAPTLKKRLAALSRAHEMRKFEIENYWKRATYFWAFQVAAFALLGLMCKELGGQGNGHSGLPKLALLAPTILGAISAEVAWLSARGSKFWQENWEAHVDLLEDSSEGRLTQVVLAKSRPSFSVSRANQWFLGLLTLGWAVGTLLVIFDPPACFLESVRWWALCFLVAVGIGLPVVSRTKLDGLVFESGENGWRRTDSAFYLRLVEAARKLFRSRARIFLRDTLSDKREVADTASRSAT